ncbi:hypothetical protein RQP46_008113 [Phenoliferia psychrophenolica]
MDPSSQQSALLGGLSQSDDASAASAASALPSATFATLPLELKSLIVTYVCANDREHKEYRSRAGAAEAALIKVVETPWHGRGLYAVAAVSQELNIICAEHLFRTLTTTKAASPFFVHPILAKHVKHIRILDLSGLLPLAKKAFDILPLLTNLSEVRISSATAWKLFGVWFSARLAHHQLDPKYASEADEAVRRALFRLRTQSVAKVHLNGTCLERMGGILSAFDNLQSISIGGPEPITSFDLLGDDLVYVMARLPRLRDLTLELPENTVFTDAWVENHTAWPSLTSLTLRGIDPLPSTFDFVAKFATTLESLDLSFKHESTLSDNQPSQLFQHPFPHLSHLRMVDLELSTACVILDSLATPAVPITSPLLRLDLELRKPTSTPTHRKPFRNALQRFNTNGLHIAELRVVEHGSREELWCLRDLEYSPQTTVSLGNPKDLFFDRMPILHAERIDEAVVEQVVERRATALLNTLEFGREHILALWENSDLVGMETAFEALKTLRVWQKVVSGK